MKPAEPTTSAPVPSSAQASEEFVRRLVYSLLKPSARIADRFGLSLKQLAQLTQLVFYEHKRRRGLSIKEISKEFQTSTRTVDRLIKSLREDFFEPEHEHELPRRIEFLLWAEPLGAARIAQLLPEHPEQEVFDALDALVEQKRVMVQAGRTTLYACTQRANRLPDSTEAAKVDALNHLLGTVIQAVERRFFERDPRAGARNVALRIRPEDFERIEALYEQHIWPLLTELDAHAEEAEDAVELGWVTCWSPLDSQD